MRNYFLILFYCFFLQLFLGYLAEGITFQINGSTLLYGVNNYNSYGVNSEYYDNNLFISATRYSSGDNRGALYGYDVDLTTNLSLTSSFQTYGAAGNYRYGAGLEINSNNQILFVGSPGYNSNKGIVYAYDLYNRTDLFNISEATSSYLGIKIATYQSYLAIRDQNFKTFVYNFSRSGATFMYSLNYSGIDLAVDNNYLVIGADTGGSSYGTIYVHHLLNGSLAKQINGTQRTNFRLGFRVCFNYPYIIGSAPFLDGGYVQVFDMSNNYQMVANIGGQTSGERFGYSISLSPDNLLLVGAPQFNSSTGRTDLINFLVNTSSIYTWPGLNIGNQGGYTSFIFSDIIVIHNENYPNNSAQYGSAEIYHYQLFDETSSTTTAEVTTSTTAIVSTSTAETSTSSTSSISTTLEASTTSTTAESSTSVASTSSTSTTSEASVSSSTVEISTTSIVSTLSASTTIEASTTASASTSEQLVNDVDDISWFLF